MTKKPLARKELKERHVYSQTILTVRTDPSSYAEYEGKLLIGSNVRL